MITFLKRLYFFLSRAWFYFYYKSIFELLGNNSYIHRPFRIDGGNSICIGAKTFFQRGAWLYCIGLNGLDSKLSIGEECVFGYNNHIAAVREVIIGKSVLTANNVYISDNIHGYENVNIPIINQPVLFKGSVEIGDGTWIGENACIIGAKIGKNCVIGSNAVVTRDIPDYSIAVGVPAKVIKKFDIKLQKWVTVKK